MTAPDGLLKIGEFARIADTNLRTLRYYEELGMLEPAARSTGGFRYYRQTDINRIRMIRDLQELGLNLERIRELISTREALDDRAEFVRRVRKALEEHDRLLSERMEALADQRDKVRTALGKIDECKHCLETPSPKNNFCEPCRTSGHPLPDHLSALF